MSMCYVNSLWHCVYVLGRHGMVCVFVLELPLPRETKLTEWVYSSDSDLLYGSVFEYPVVPTSDKLNFPNWQAGMINRIEFRVWNSLVVRWSMEIIRWYPGDVASKSRAWHWTRYRDVLMVFSSNHRCRCCWGTFAEPNQKIHVSKIRNRKNLKTHHLIFSEHQKLCKNSSWAPISDDLKKGRFFEQIFHVFVLT